MKFQRNYDSKSGKSPSSVYLYEGVDYLFIGYIVTYNNQRIVRVYADEATDTAIITILDDEPRLTIEELDHIGYLVDDETGKDVMDYVWESDKPSIPPYIRYGRG